MSEISLFEFMCEIAHSRQATSAIMPAMTLIIWGITHKPDTCDALKVPCADAICAAAIPTDRTNAFRVGDLCKRFHFDVSIFDSLKFNDLMDAADRPQLSLVFHELTLDVDDYVDGARDKAPRRLG